jgi:rod shape-determining protein MreD
MGDRDQNRFAYCALFVLLVASVLFVQLLPLNPGPGRLPGPDIVLLIVFAWTIMHPNLLPIWLIAGVVLVADLLLMRPPGLWAGLVVLGCEFLRSRWNVLRTAPFLVEWGLVAGLITALILAKSAILGIFAVPQPSFGLTMIHLVVTVLIYPIVVLLAGRMFGLRRGIGEADGFGTRR